MNAFGRIFTVQILGESHGAGIGVVLDGVPAGIALNEFDFEADITRRKAGLTAGTTTRIETDKPIIKTGLFKQFTTGAPLHIWFENNNTKSEDYLAFQEVPRPGHADFVAQAKFKGYNDPRGGGHFSGRLTLPIVAAGVVAKKILQHYYTSLRVEAKLIQAGGLADIEAAIQLAIAKNDSIGGIVACTVTHMPIGLGEPFWDSVESVISHAIFYIPAVKGIGFGSGFEAANMYGSQHNDAWINEQGKTNSNYAGGINGGISNGNDLYFTVAIKPTSSTPQTQHTFNFKTAEMEDFTVKGRHDLCIALRAPVVVEAMTAIALADLCLLHRK